MLHYSSPLQTLVQVCNFTRATPPASLVVFSPVVCSGERFRWCALPWSHPLRVITVTNNPTMTASTNCFKNKDGILIWYLRARLSVDPVACLLFFPVYIWKLQRCVFVCGLGHGRKAFCVACLHYHDVFTWLPACAPVAWCCYVSKGPNCGLRRSDKQIEQASFLPALFGYMQNRFIRTQCIFSFLLPSFFFGSSVNNCTFHEYFCCSLQEHSRFKPMHVRFTSVI